MDDVDIPDSMKTKANIAWVRANGVVEWGTEEPEGSALALLPELAGRRGYRSAIESLCRLAYDNKTLLVPGLPEAPGDMDAFLRFGTLCKRYILRGAKGARRGCVLGEMAYALAIAAAAPLLLAGLLFFGAHVADTWNAPEYPHSGFCPESPAWEEGPAWERPGGEAESYAGDGL